LTWRKAPLKIGAVQGEIILPGDFMRRLFIGLAALAFGFVSDVGGAAAQQGQLLQIGTLFCDVSAGIGMIIASQKSVQCTFAPAQLTPPAPPPPAELYIGSIKKVGIDIGATSAGQMIWAVYAPTTTLAPGALAGVYAGATAEATVAVGLGANVLVGGSSSTIALQPLSITGQTGLNVAAGIASLELRAQQ
jgi:Protein of unknown function (DUF992)